MNDGAPVIHSGGFAGTLEETACPTCRPAPPPRRLYLSAEGIGYWRCPQCQIEYASPRFDEASLLRIYENAAFLIDKSAHENWTHAQWQRQGGRDWRVPHLKVALVKKYAGAHARVLDVGCATGVFCRAGLDEGLRCEGIDVSKMLTDIARDVVKVPVQQIDVEHFDPPYRFGGIVIWDVLEHLYDPGRVLRACHRLLEPGGFIFAQVPNHRGVSNTIKALTSRLGLKRKGYSHFGFPHHVYSFDKKSLTAMLAAAGFATRHFESWSHLYKDGATGAYAGFLIALTKKYCLTDYIIVVARKSPD